MAINERRLLFLSIFLSIFLRFDNDDILLSHYKCLSSYQ